MSWSKLAAKSILSGTVTTILLAFVSLLAGNKTVSKMLLSPLAILANQFSPHFGANPAREATPASGLIIILGLFLCVLFYSIISFLAAVIISRLGKPDALK